MDHAYLTVGEVAEYLRISLSKAYALTRQKEFPVCRLGSSIRIPRKEFVTWVERHTHCVSGPPSKTLF